MSRPQIAIVSREIHPFGGGIGTYAACLSRFLADQAEVTVFVSSLREEQMSEPRYREQSLLDSRVNVVFVEEPTDQAGYFGILHRYSANVLRALRREYGRRGPDMVEFQDYLGEGAVTVQARTTREPFLADTEVSVRLNTTGELCELLDGYMDRGEWAVQTVALERYSLRFADRLLYGGGDIYGLYGRMYGARNLAPGHLLRQPLGPDGPIPRSPPGAPPGDGPLKLIYLGRLERRKGVADLVRALSWTYAEAELTMVGGDTETAPLGTSMRWLLDQGAERGMTDYVEAAVNPVRFVEHVPRAELPALIDAHHAAVIPSLWECWPAVGLEVLSRNRPLIATPVGGLVEMAQAGRSGWLTTGGDQGRGLATTIERLAGDRASLDELIAGNGPRSVHDELCDPDDVREWYARSRPGARPGRATERRSAAALPLVSAIVPYYHLPAFVEDAVQSLLDQTYPRIEIVVVNDGSFDFADRIVGRLVARQLCRVVTQANSGLGAARNLGIRASRGRYILLLDADNMFEPSFVERAVSVLEDDPTVAYAGSWTRYVDQRGVSFHGADIGYQPLSNSSELMLRRNVAGDAAALVRRAIYDRGFWYSEELTSYEDWDFYERLRRAGHYGHCIPERLMRYRVRDQSMLRDVALQESARLDGELIAHREASEVEWVSPNV